MRRPLLIGLKVIITAMLLCGCSGNDSGLQDVSGGSNEVVLIGDWPGDTFAQALSEKVQVVNALIAESDVPVIIAKAPAELSEDEWSTAANAFNNHGTPVAALNYTESQKLAMYAQLGDPVDSGEPPMEDRASVFTGIVKDSDTETAAFTVTNIEDSTLAYFVDETVDWLFHEGAYIADSDKAKLQRLGDASIQATSGVETLTGGQLSSLNGSVNGAVFQANLHSLVLYSCENDNYFTFVWGELTTNMNGVVENPWWNFYAPGNQQSIGQSLPENTAQSETFSTSQSQSVSSTVSLTNVSVTGTVSWGSGTSQTLPNTIIGNESDWDAEDSAGWQLANTGNALKESVILPISVSWNSTTAPFSEGFSGNLLKGSKYPNIADLGTSGIIGDGSNGTLNVKSPDPSTCPSN